MLPGAVHKNWKLILHSYPIEVPTGETDRTRGDKWGQNDSFITTAACQSLTKLLTNGQPTPLPPACLASAAGLARASRETQEPDGRLSSNLLLGTFIGLILGLT